MRNVFISLLLATLASCASGISKPRCSLAGPFTPCTSEWRPDAKAPYNPTFNPNHHNGKQVQVVGTRNNP
jgi:hypothetical protein